MDMHDLNMSILTQLNAINKDVGDFSAGVLSNDISHDDQIAFAHRLVDLAEAIRERALRTPRMVIEGVVDDRSAGTNPRASDETEPSAQEDEQPDAGGSTDRSRMLPDVRQPHAPGLGSQRPTRYG